MTSTAVGPIVFIQTFVVKPWPSFYGPPRITLVVIELLFCLARIFFLIVQNLSLFTYNLSCTILTHYWRS